MYEKKRSKNLPVLGQRHDLLRLCLLLLLGAFADFADDQSYERSNSNKIGRCKFSRKIIPYSNLNDNFSTLHFLNFVGIIHIGHFCSIPWRLTAIGRGICKICKNCHRVKRLPGHWSVLQDSSSKAGQGAPLFSDC